MNNLGGELNSAVASWLNKGLCAPPAPCLSVGRNRPQEIGGRIELSSGESAKQGLADSEAVVPGPPKISRPRVAGELTEGCQLAVEADYSGGNPGEMFVTWRCAKPKEGAAEGARYLPLHTARYLPLHTSLYIPRGTSLYIPPFTYRQVPPSTYREALWASSLDQTTPFVPPLRPPLRLTFHPLRAPPTSLAFWTFVPLMYNTP
eukprot:1047172-Prorocentrum_minimum.AAC.1